MLQTLTRFLPIALKVIPRKTSIPILGCVCIDDGYIRATDLETTLRMPIEDQRSYVVPLSILKKVLKSKPKLLEIELEKENKAKLTYDDKTLTFPRMDVEEFPALPKKRFLRIGVWTKDIFLKLYQLIPFCSTDELKPGMNGIFIKQNETLSASGTDGHILKLVKNLDPEGKCKLKKEFEGILPRKSLQVLSRFVAGNVKVASSQSHLRFQLPGNLEVFVRLIDDRYPDVESVIPEKFEGSVELEKQRLFQLIKEARAFTPRDTHKSRFSVNGEYVDLTVEDPEAGTLWESSMPFISRSGSRIDIGYDLILLERIVKSIDDQEVVWEFNTPVSASIFKGSNGNDLDGINLIMPMRLSGE